MISRETVKELEKQLTIRRKEIFDFRSSLKASRTDLQERENELEEMAGKGVLLDGVERMDERVVEELRKIDAALMNMQSGSYGRCDACKRPISAKRLRALPWTTVCKRCALDRETKRTVDTGEQEGPQEEMSDDRIVEALWDELDRKEDLILDDLHISSNDGTIYLTGRVPTDKEHQQVLEIIAEDMGYEDLIDRIGIDDLARRNGETDEDEEVYEKECAMHGLPPEDDFYNATDDNRSVVPPDQLVTEDDR